MTKGKNTDWDHRDPWTLGCRTAVHKLRLLPAHKLLESEWVLPRPRPCGRKMLGAPCCLSLELTSGRDLLSWVRGGPVVTPHQGSDPHPHPQYWPAQLSLLGVPGRILGSESWAQWDLATGRLVSPRPPCSCAPAHPEPQHGSTRTPASAFSCSPVCVFSLPLPLPPAGRRRILRTGCRELVPAASLEH